MNNENNNFNSEQNIINNNQVPNTEVMTQPVQVTTPVVEPSTEVITQPVMATTPVVEPSTEVITQPAVAPAPIFNSVPTTEVMIQPVVEPSTEVMTQPVPVPTTESPILEPTPIVMPTTEAPTPSVLTSPPQVDNNAMVNEDLKKVEIKDYTPPSRFKVFVLLLFFAGLVVFIIFLPQISSYIRNYGSDKYEKVDEVITTGKLICIMDTNTSDLDKEYEFDFSFVDSKLKRTKYIEYTRGDSTTELALDELAEKCKTLKEETSELEGVSIRCEYSDGKLTETQTFELETVDEEELNAAFTEAGGILPSYKYEQDIDDIEKNMKASGYTCEREK